MNTTLSKCPYTMHISPTNPVLLVAAATEIVSAGIATKPIWDDARLTAFCVMGSILGALLHISFFSPNEGIHTDKNTATKFVCSMVSGILFTSPVIYYFKIEFTADLILAVSGAVAFLFIVLGQMAVPILKSWFSNKLSNYIGNKNKE